MNKTLLVSALLLTTVSAHAVDAPQWNQASIGWVGASFDNNIDLGGLAIAGNYLVNDNVFLTGRSESTKDDIISGSTTVNLKLTRLSLGAGYRYELNTTTDLFGKATFESYKASASAPYRGFTISAEETTNGLAFEGGVRSMVHPNIELAASLSLIRMNVDAGEDGNETSLNASAAYHFNDRFSAGLGVSKMEDARFTELKAIMSF
ncbi:porin family protein [Marinomonas sp. CT5]|uniref:porin family protein n=1 Tax=Marinomonas sp. CT5 TaxID=2066133 RepID=UPI001BB08D7C|nr:porin family protein [Marinomonas sp. CT5]